METVKEIVGMAAITLLLGLLTWALADSYIEEYDLLSAEPSNAFIVEKTAAKGLFTSPAYYVWTEIEDGEGTRSLNRVSKSQMENIEIGDTFNGYSTGSSSFSSLRDILADSFFYLIVFFLLGFLTLCCFIALIFSVLETRRPGKKKSPKRQVKQKQNRKRRKNGGRKRTGWGIAGAAVLVFLLISGRFVLNLIRKLLPFGKTEAEALIIDKSEDISYRRHEDSVHELIVSFRDQAGQNIEVMRDVTSSTYNQYDIGSMLPIAYRSADPYDIFVRGTSITDVFQQTFMFYELYMYIALLAASAFVGWAYIQELKKRKKVRREHDKRKGKGK
ncbi:MULTISPECIES: hypothetical protein [unclassified Sporosarcina]|uniref:hypothetical protein n=1 Tax=unclassified Sporosarcina TaxID=2647733 RepID=UPI00203F1642|nr:MULTISPECIES: hypothetical protein [unclassified Sporosarcina]GKV67183.1 hypothetical protein NCCP2331_33360 [Sporosarcina sp. NCCP-2331]GLB57551.1 hypothetical protein NCCP2378_33400 [Sporosarcina sp. NCCP-2378]